MALGGGTPAADNCHLVSPAVAETSSRESSGESVSSLGLPESAVEANSGFCFTGVRDHWLQACQELTASPVPFAMKIKSKYVLYCTVIFTLWMVSVFGTVFFLQILYEPTYGRFWTTVTMAPFQQLPTQPHLFHSFPTLPEQFKLKRKTLIEAHFPLAGKPPITSQMTTEEDQLLLHIY